MKIPPIHYAVILLMDDFNLSASQVSERLELSLRYVYKIKNTYREGATLTPDHNYKNDNNLTKKRLEKYTIKQPNAITEAT